MFVSDCSPCTVFTYVWMMNKENIHTFKHFRTICFPITSQTFTCIPLESMNLCRYFVLMTNQWVISLYILLNILHCYRGPLKSGQSQAPVLKPNNLIPPNVPTSLSSYMSHNIISAIFRHSSQSLSDRFYITNRENMCPPNITADFTSVCQEQEVSLCTVLYVMQGVTS